MYNYKENVMNSEIFFNCVFISSITHCPLTITSRKICFLNHRKKIWGFKNSKKGLLQASKLKKKKIKSDFLKLTARNI